MGHRLSKSPKTSASGSYTPNTEQINNIRTSTTASKNTEQSKRIPIPPLVGPTINLQIQESPTTSRGGSNFTSKEQLSDSGSNSLSSGNNSCPRQIIIKIQLAKMENGNEQHQQQAQETLATESLQHGTDTNLNQIVNVTLNRNLLCGESEARDIERGGTAGGSTAASTSGLNNNFSNNHALTDEQLEQVTAGLAEFAVSSEDDVLEAVNHMCVAEANVKSCCRRKSKTSSTYLPKRRCYKCTCRDAIKRIIETSSSSSSSKSTKHKERKDNKHSKNSAPECAAVRSTAHAQAQCANPNSMTTSAPIAIAAAAAGNATASGSNQLSIWSPNSSDVIIPINSQFVVVQCPSTSVMTVGCIDDNAIRLMTTEIVGADGTVNHNSNMSTLKMPQVGPIVHSQVDFVHCLVPDLEKITNSSFYWGKMDRYEAERLLEGKPEGTFLLRDSAQEEFLFSVTFRKYGRSLHARIEQGGHKFSFDCHDPCVFTADTVTGLLEHYKDPACVMFFEPMLTIPLNRKNTFSLQQLCRASIVSHTTYDGITELELPARLKTYLKEYHYKQKLRVKPFDEPFYTCT